MNQLNIIGNVTKDPELRKVKTNNGEISVCDFTVAVNDRRKKDESTFFRCTAWRGLAEVVCQFVSKGKKIAVTGSVSAHAYMSKDSKEPRAMLDVSVNDVEFLSPRGEAFDNDLQGMTAVHDEDMPF